MPNRYVAEVGAFRADQFTLAEAGVLTITTGPEAWRQNKGKIDSFVDFGSGGTFVGVSKFLKDQRPEIPCIVVEPANGAVLAGSGGNGKHRIQGGGYMKPFQTFLCSGKCM